LSAAGRIRSIEKFNDFIGNRTRDLPARSIVPQPTTLPRAVGMYISTPYNPVRVYLNRGSIEVLFGCSSIEHVKEPWLLATLPNTGAQFIA
jgi:hypothetical protein